MGTCGCASQHGRLGIASHFLNQLSALSKPVPSQRDVILAFLHRLTLPVNLRAMEIIDSIGLVTERLHEASAQA